MPKPNLEAQFGGLDGKGSQARCPDCPKPFACHLACSMGSLSGAARLCWRPTRTLLIGEPSNADVA